MKQLYFLYNPHAGRGQAAAKLSALLDIFVKAGYELTVRPTQYAGEAVEVVENLRDGYDLLVCSGGDGTLDEVVTGMLRRKKRIPIGYIPTGSTNDFGKSLGLPRDMMEAARAIVNGRTFACDMGTLNESHVWVYVAAFGMFTDVSYETTQDMKNLLGHMAYILEGAKRLGKVKSYKMKVLCDDLVIEDEFIFGMVTNSRSVGGFPNLINKHEVAFDDGKLEVTLVRRPKNLFEIQNIVNALLVEEFDSKYMYTFQAAQITFESEEEVAWTMDGEAGGEHTQVRIACVPQAVQIVLPEAAIPNVSIAYLIGGN